MQEYSIGGQEVKRDLASEGIADIPRNKTLFIQKLTNDPPATPEIVKGLKTVDDVFNHFKPSTEIEFDREDGSTLAETIHFNNLGDFGKKGIVKQSNFLQDLNLQLDESQKLMRQLKSNKIFKMVLENADAKKAYLDSIKSLLVELEEAN